MCLYLWDHTTGVKSSRQRVWTRVPLCGVCGYEFIISVGRRPCLLLCYGRPKDAGRAAGAQ